MANPNSFQQEFKKFLKSFLDPIFTYYFQHMNNIARQTRWNENNITYCYSLAIGGGEALNYYYPIGQEFQTGDFDLRIFRTRIENINGKDIYIPDHVTAINDINQSYKIEEVSGEVLTYFANNVNTLLDFYRTIPDINLKIPGLNNIFGKKLLNLSFEYKQRGYVDRVIYYDRNANLYVPQERSIIDLFKYAKGFSDQLHIDNIQNNYTIGDESQKNKDKLDFYNNNKALIRNDMQILVEDLNTHNIYMALGDIANDTARMIIWSAKQTPVYNTNKKYIVKFSKIISAINKLTEIFNCNKENLNLVMCYRSDENKDCDGNPIPLEDTIDYKDRVKNFIYKFYCPDNDLPVGWTKISDIISSYPIYKLCNIGKGLILSGYDII